MSRFRPNRNGRGLTSRRRTLNGDLARPIGFANIRQLEAAGLLTWVNRSRLDRLPCEGALGLRICGCPGATVDSVEESAKIRGHCLGIPAANQSGLAPVTRMRSTGLTQGLG